MRRLSRILTLLALTGLCLFTVAPAQASHPQRHPVTTVKIAGVIQGGTAYTLQAGPNVGVDKSTFNGRCSVPSSLLIGFKGTGLFTELGTVSLEGWHCTLLNVPAQTGTYRDGTMTLKATGGDSLTFTHTGEFRIVDNVTYLTSTGTITGGTGRFRGATGTTAEFGQQNLKTDLLQVGTTATVSYHPADHAR